MKTHSIGRCGLLATFALAACEEFTPGSLITDTRVLGARVEVVGDEQRASPRPGESATVRWLVVAPDDAPALAWAFVACAADAADCAEAALQDWQGRGTAPELTLALPSREALGVVKRIRIHGILCDGGTPDLDGEGARCVGSSRKATPVTLDVTVGDGDDVNFNPRIDGAALEIDGIEWSANSLRALAPASDAGALAPSVCAEDADMPQIQAGSRSRRIVLTLGAEARETMLEAGEPVLELLQISQFATAGELERQFSIVERADARERPELTFDWEPPSAKQLKEGDAQTVRFYLVVRDLRGGLSVIERALCLLR